MLAALPLVAASLLASHGALANPNPGPHPYNSDNPYTQRLKRAITNDVTQVSGKSFDFIVAGGGLAGLAVASRLSEWSNITVLVIEAGGDGTDVQDQINIPGYSYLKSLTGSAYDWAYNTVPQVDSGGGTKYWPRGKGLGGSGAINGMYWCRGSEKDYNAWNTLNPGGAQDWGWSEVTRCINKAENYTAPPQSQQSQMGMKIDAAAHGSGGPIQIGFPSYMYDIVANWMPSFIAMGIPANDGADGNTRGANISPLTLNARNQTRSDSKAGYIDPLPPRSNLVILTGQQVTQVLFNGSTDASGNQIASGVQFAAARGAQSYSVQANKEVILSGGTVGSPQILQLSGIGPRDKLTAVGVTPKIDLPVGYNLQDHISVNMYWSTPQGTLTWNNLTQTPNLSAQQLQQYQSSASGMWTFVNGAVGYPSMADLMGSASAASSYATSVNSALNQTWQNTVNWQSLPANVATGLAAQYEVMASNINTDEGQIEMLFNILGPNNNVQLQIALQHPWSRGNIFITSTDAFTAPAINPDYFGVGYDIDMMGYGSQFARRLATTAPMNTITITETNPGANVVDDALGNWTKINSGTEYHPLGTCSMLPQASGGVVDTNLIVYGTSNIRVVDSSIMPLHISAHLMATTYGIAEKAAEIIKQKYFLVQPSTTSSASSGGSGASQTSASIASATDSSVLSGGNKGSTGTALSQTAIIGIGAGVGAGAAAIIIALIVFFCIRRKRKASPQEKGWYESAGGRYGNTDIDPYADNDQGQQALYAAPGTGRETPPPNSGNYPMANFAPPSAPYNRHQRNFSSSQSISTMATADLASREPMRNSTSGYGNFGDDGGSGATTPQYVDDHNGYPVHPPQGVWSPNQQRYRPVEPR